MEEVSSTQIFGNEQPNNIVEVSLKEFDDMVLKKHALDRLISNPDFQAIINDDYLDKDAVRLNGFLMSRNIQAIKDRDIILEKIVAKGILKHWLSELGASLEGIDNPEQREELVRQLREMEAANE